MFNDVPDSILVATQFTAARNVQPWGFWGAKVVITHPRYRPRAPASSSFPRMKLQVRGRGGHLVPSCWASGVSLSGADLGDGVALDPDGVVAVDAGFRVPGASDS